MNAPHQPTKIVMFGTGDIGSVAHYYFSNGSPFDVVAFTADDNYVKEKEFRGLPVVGFSEVQRLYPPETFGMFVALGYKNVNKFRETKYHEAKAKGYTLVSYVAPGSDIARDVPIGDNCMVLAHQVIAPFAKIGNDNILLTGNYIGHHTTVDDHCFIAHAMVAGHVHVGSNTFLGIGSVVRDNLTLAKGSLIGAGALILHDTVEEGVYRAEETQRHFLKSGSMHRIRGPRQQAA